MLMEMYSFYMYCICVFLSQVRAVSTHLHTVTR